MKIACVTFPIGCPRSEIDAGLLIKFLKANEWNVIEDIGSADIVFIGTCGVHRLAEEKSIEYLAVTSKMMKENARLVAYGCLPGINKNRITEQFGADTLSYHDLTAVDELINAKVKIKDIREPNILPDYEEQSKNLYASFDKIGIKLRLLKKFPGQAKLRISVGKGPTQLYEKYNKIFNLRISKGCSSSCSYCAIRYATGPTKSKSISKILEEFQSGLKQKNFVFKLMADDVGSYGQDIGPDICKLLEKIFEYNENFKVFWDEFNAKWLIKYFNKMVPLLSKNYERIGYVGFPIQSGSQRIIELMNRDYSVDEVKKCLLELKKSVPNLRLSTHIIVGFPGEQDVDFNQSIEFLRAIKFNEILIFKYDDRPKTVASNMKEKISESVKLKRIAILRREFINNSRIC